MKQHFSHSLASHKSEPSRLLLKKLKGSTTYTNIRKPVGTTTKGISFSLNDAKEQVELQYSLEPCQNTFISNFKPKSSLISKDTISRTARAAAEAKGVSSVVQRYQNIYRIYSKESLVYHCDFFRVMYYPPDHFLSMFRKSKPAINVRTVGQVFLNGNVLNPNKNGSKTIHSVFQNNSGKYGFTKVQDICKKFSNVFNNNPCNIPSNYAFLRRQLRIIIKKCFISEWCKLHGDKAVDEDILSQKIHDTDGLNWKYLDACRRTLPGVAKDGYYSYQVLVFPDKYTKSEFEANIRKSVQVIANLEWDTLLKPQNPDKKGKNKTWVQKANDRVNRDSLNKLLSSSEIPYSLK